MNSLQHKSINFYHQTDIKQITRAHKIIQRIFFSNLWFIHQEPNNPDSYLGFIKPKMGLKE